MYKFINKIYNIHIYLDDGQLFSFLNVACGIIKKKRVDKK